MPRRKVRKYIVLVMFASLLALLAAACGSNDVQLGNTTTSGGAGNGAPGEPLDYPRGERDLVLRVEQGGGFLPVEAVFTMVPGFSLYGDGRVIFSGPIPEIFPGPALANLQQVQLSEEGVQQLLQAAREAGLTEDLADLGQPPVADASTTKFTLNVNGETHEIDAYALGYEPEFPGGATPPGEAEGADAGGDTGDGVTGSPGDVAPSSPGEVAPGSLGEVAPGAGETAVEEEQASPVFELTEEQREARLRLLEFQSRLFDLRSWLGEEVGLEQAFAFEAVDVISQPADPQTAEPSGIERSIQQWPLGDLATLGEPESRGRRFQVKGADLDELRPLLEQANALTLWQSGDATYALYFRPLLPDEVESTAPRTY
jgi:hypothetical protein